MLAFGFLGVGVLLAKYAYPKLAVALDSIPLRSGASIQPRDEVHLVVVVAAAAAAAAAAVAAAAAAAVVVVVVVVVA